MITIHDYQLNHSDSDLHQELHPSFSCRCCLLLRHSCCRGMEDSELASSRTNEADPFRFVLTGPPKSGRSSLLFHLACSVLARDPHATVAYVRGLDSDVEDTANEGGNYWLPLDGCCLAEMSDTVESSILCGVAASQSVSLQSQTQALSSYLNQPAILSRIQMHHVVCIRDVYELLFSGSLFSNHGSFARPSLIVMDDLDRLFPSQKHGTQDPHMAISQLLSVLVDMANNSPASPISVAVSMTANPGSSPVLFSPTVPLETIQISIPPSDGASKQLLNRTNAVLNEQLPDMVVTGIWSLERGRNEEGVSLSKSRQYYAIMKDGMDADYAGKRLLMHLGGE